MIYLLFVSFHSEPILLQIPQVYKEYPDLQQQQRKFSFDQPEPSMDVTPESTTGPMLESFIPGGRNQQTITGKYAGDGMMLEKLLPDGRQRQPATTQDPTRKVRAVLMRGWRVVG